MSQAATLDVRELPEWIGATPDTPVPLRVKVRVFTRHDGRCHRSGRKIMPGDRWDTDHVLAIINGGQNRESNLAPILLDRHREKSAEDVAIKSKTARVRAKHLGVYPKPARPIPRRANPWGKNRHAR